MKVLATRCRGIWSRHTPCTLQNVALRHSQRGVSTRGANVAVSKSATLSSRLYYGNSEKVAARAACARRSKLIDLGIAESYPTLRTVLEAEALIPCAAQGSSNAITEGEICSYGESEALRAVVASVMAENILRAHPRPASADEVVITSGATAAIEALAFALCNHGDALIVPAPYYPAFYIDVGMRAGVKIVIAPPSPQTGIITRAGLEAAAKQAQAEGCRVAAVLFTSPCNPRGILHSREETAVVEQFVVEHDIDLIWDAVYAGTVYDEQLAIAAAPRLPAQHIKRLHTVWGLAKDCGLSGWRVGAIHSFLPELIGALQPQMRFSGASRLAQAATLALIGDVEKTRRCMRLGAGALSARANAGRTALREGGVPEQALGRAPQAGPLDLIDFSADGKSVDEELLWEIALDIGVHTVRGEACGGQRGSLRVCWGAAASNDQAAEAASRIARAWIEYKDRT